MTEIEAILRTSMLTTAALMGLGTAGELLLLWHVESPPQILPFVAIGAGLVAIVAVVVAPGRGSLLSLRGVAVALLLAGAFGVFEHLEHNYAFEAEIRPGEGAWLLAKEAVLGANPALAPGAVAVMGLLAGLATVRDPRLARD